MNPRIKKLIGAIVMVVWIAIYAFLAMLPERLLRTLSELSSECKLPGA